MGATTSEEGVPVGAGLMRTRTGRLVPIPEPTAAPAEAPGRRSRVRMLSIGFACVVVAVLLVSVVLSATDGNALSLESLIGDFGHVIREVRGPGL